MNANLSANSSDTKKLNILEPLPPITHAIKPNVL